MPSRAEHFIEAERLLGESHAESFPLQHATVHAILACVPNEVQNQVLDIKGAEALARAEEGYAPTPLGTAVAKANRQGVI